MKTTLDRIIFSLIYILIFLSAIGRIQYLATIDSFWIRLYRISIYLIIILGFSYILLRRKVEFKGVNRLLCLMVLYGLIVSLVRYRSINQTLVNEFIIDVLAWPVVFILIQNLFKNLSILKTFRKITMCGVVLIVGITAINLFNLNSLEVNSAIGGGTYCVAVLPLVYFFFSKKVGNFFTIIVMILIMISTKRSSFLALLLGIFVYYISDAIVQKTSRKKLNKMLSLMLMVVIVSVVGLYLINTSDIEIFQRFTSEDTTLSGRTVLWGNILIDYGSQGFGEKLFGNGMHAVKYKFNPYGLGWYAHNSFIETLYDYGVIGLVALIVFVIFIIKKTVNMNIKKRQLAPVMSSTIPPLLFYAVASYFFEVGQIILFYSFIWSLCIAVEEKVYLKQQLNTHKICCNKEQRNTYIKPENLARKGKP